MRTFSHRLNVLPFETATAVLGITTGVIALVGFGASYINVFLGPWFYLIWSAFIAASVLMLIGIGLGKGRIEAPGLVLFSAILAVRFVITLHVLGLTADTFLLLTYFVLMVGACYYRVKMLRRTEAIVTVKM